MVEYVEPNDADWIIISTPNDLHHEQVEYWLSKRKNVFCEKPLTLTRRSAEALFSLADFFNVKLYVDDVFSWRKTGGYDVTPTGEVFDALEDEYVIEDTNKFTWMKPNQKDKNYIDRLAYHHFYMWLGDDDDFEVKSVTGDLNNFKVELEDGRVSEFSYGDTCREVIHTINEHDMTYSADNPLRTMFEFLFSNAGDYELNRKMTLNAIKLSEIVKKELYPKVLVVGGGIFGTTASVALATSGYNVTLHEELDGIMKCASDINQYRLHKGYHYPRSKETSQECLDGLKSFKRKYGDSVVNGDVEHLYAISSHDSLVSSEEYIKFLDEMGLEYNLHEPLIGTDLTIEADEELFDSDKLRIQVTQKMKGAGVKVVRDKKTTKEDFEDFDYVVIATYAKMNELLDEPRQYQYEVVEKPVVKLPKKYKNKSVVVMDGPFMCLDPYKNGYHVLGHVEHAIHSTNVGHYPMVLNKHIIAYLNNGVIHNPHITKINKFIEAGMEFFEDFDKLEHIGSMFTIRTVLAHRDHDDARPTLVKKENDNTFSIFSGKIGTCVQAANQLVDEIEKCRI